MEIDRYPHTPFGRGRRTPGRHGYVAYFPAKIPRRLDLPAATVAILAQAVGLSLDDIATELGLGVDDQGAARSA